MSLIDEINNKIKIRTCRICLDAQSVDMVLIEEQNGWLALFEFCFGFTITTQDEPRLICQICAEKIKSYVKFKEKCQKSHNLWKSVISDVKCCIVKHENVENPTITEENANDPVTFKAEIKDETFDPSFDSDHFSNDDDSETVKFSHHEIKMENQKDDTKPTVEESNVKEKDCLATNKVHSKQLDYKIGTGQNNGQRKIVVNRTRKKVYTCPRCKASYGGKCWFVKHKKVCQGKGKRRKNMVYNQEYSYDLGRKYDGQNIAKVKQKPRNKTELIETETDSLFSCGLCNLSFSCSKELFIHLNEHWSNNELACQLCDFVGVDLAAIVSHRFSHLPRNKLRFVCHICENNELSLMALHFHYRKEHLNKAGGYCSRCNKEYHKLRYWKKHEKTHFANYICDICGSQFFYKSDIIAHMMDHMQLNRSVCEICGKVFTRHRYIKSHMETVHYQSGRIQCTHCDRTFKSQFNLKCHLKNVAREKPLKCEVCHKGFTTPRLLKFHMITHSDAKPFSCDLCGRHYKRKAHLTEHLNKHNGVSPQCLICMKTFATVMSLKRHSSVHTGVRRHSCTVTGCERSFHSKKPLMAHLQRHHKNEIRKEISEKSEVFQEEVV